MCSTTDSNVYPRLVVLTQTQTLNLNPNPTYPFTCKTSLVPGCPASTQSPLQQWWWNALQLKPKITLSLLQLFSVSYAGDTFRCNSVPLLNTDQPPQYFSYKAVVDYTSSELCTPITPFPADRICSKRITMHCQWLGKCQKLPPSTWDFVTPPEKNRATAKGKMRKKLVKVVRVVPEICSRTDRQTDRRTNTQTCSSQYFANALAGEVINMTTCYFHILFETIDCED